MSERFDKVNNQLDELLGIKESEPEVPAKVDNKSVAPYEGNNITYEGELIRSLDEMERLSNIGASAFENAVEQYSAYGKDRTIEVAGAMLRSLVNLKTEKRETLKAMFAKDKEEKEKGDTNINNVNVYTDSIKDLLKSIPEQKVVVVDRQDYSDDKDAIFELSIKKEHEPKLEQIDVTEYDKEYGESTIKLIFKSASDMNKFKYRVIEKFDKEIIL